MYSTNLRNPGGGGIPTLLGHRSPLIFLRFVCTEHRETPDTYYNFYLPMDKYLFRISRDLFFIFYFILFFIISNHCFPQISPPLQMTTYTMLVTASAYILSVPISWAQLPV